MCHLILLMPVLSLPIFWLLPVEIAAPLYVLIMLVSGLFYWLITRAMIRPVATGAEGMIGSVAEVLSRAGRTSSGYLVRAGGETWTASSTTDLKPGEEVKVTALDGLRLVVERHTGETAGGSSQRRCH